MSTFNTSTRKENISVRLKAQNIKNAQEETKKLELESRKMEERLKELKLAMGREKEQRERKGGFWKTGKNGPLNSYATDVLDKQRHKMEEPKKRSVKLLRDEKIVLPERSGEPGTMKYIADSHQILSARDKGKTLKCGQCEDRSASVTCVQCAEYFCAGCFAAFHYKGALKKHRTVPLQASGPRQCMSPRVAPQSQHRSPRQGSGASAVSASENQESSGSLHTGASGAVVKNSLLSGEYDEDDSAASFQDALKAWRNGDTAVVSPDGRSNHKQPRPVSRVVTPTVMMETSTSMTDVKQPIEINFSNNDMSYADRLLLKKHRRTDVGSHLASPRVTESVSSHRTEGEVSFIADDEDEERVDFRSLYEAVVQSDSTTPTSQGTSQSSLSIIELEDNPKRRLWNFEQTSDYKVEEVTEITAWNLQNNLQHDTSSNQTTEDTTLPPKSKPQETDSKSESMNSKPKRPASCKLRQNGVDVGDVEKDVKKDDVTGSKTKTKSIRPSSGKSRPSSTRPPSSRSRPASRAKSRAMSRLQHEGLLTKSPSTALHDVARMGEDGTCMVEHQYRSVLDEFFTGDSSGNTDRGATPGLIKKKNKDVKVSYLLYQMAPRSWRPESSLGESVSTETVQPELSEAALSCLGLDNGEKSESVLSFTYSDQLNDRVSRHNNHRFLEGHEEMNHRSNKHFPKIQHRKSAERREKTPVPQLQMERENSEYTTQPISVEEIACDTVTPSGRRSKAIVLDGDDYSTYDSYDEQQERLDDQDTLEKLEWELASESGRITADGQISRLSWKNESSDSRSSSRNSSIVRHSNDQGYDINTRLREDELFASDDENMMTDRADVLALT